MSSDSPARQASLAESRMRAARASGGTSGPAIYRVILNAMSTLGGSGDVLDFGAGTGLLLKELLASPFVGTATGVDIQSRPHDLHGSANWLQADLNEPVPLHDRSFDTIVAAEVIEHLENPRAAFREFRRLLKSGGTLLMTTPNQESLRSLASLVLRGHFVDFLDGSYPAHLTALLRKDFERVAAETGFRRPSFLYTDEGGVPGRPSVKWQTISLGLLRGRLFSDNLLVLTRRDARP